MKRPRSCSFLPALALAALASPLVADEHVAVTAYAEDEYTQGKFVDGKTRVETYVVMQGKYFEGTTVDRSIEKMPFRKIAEFLAPELAKQNYLPSRDLAKADLLLVVHWGTTVPRVTAAEMRAQITTSPDLTASAAGIERMVKDFNENKAGGGLAPEASLMPGHAASQIANNTNSIGDEVARGQEFDNLDIVADQIRSSFNTGTNSRLLGYDRDFFQFSKKMIGSAEEDTLRSDLKGERYFVIVKAYDLRQKLAPGRVRHAVWTLHVNIGSPGHNFISALAMMGPAASGYFGRTTTEVKTVRPGSHEGRVDLPPLVILGEAKSSN